MRVVIGLGSFFPLQNFYLSGETVGSGAVQETKILNKCHLSAGFANLLYWLNSRRKYAIEKNLIFLLPRALSDHQHAHSLGFGKSAG